MIAPMRQSEPCGGRVAELDARHADVQVEVQVDVQVAWTGTNRPVDLRLGGNPFHYDAGGTAEERPPMADAGCSEAASVRGPAIECEAAAGARPTALESPWAESSS